MAWDKLEGLTPKLTFLGFELDFLEWEIRSPSLEAKGIVGPGEEVGR